MKKMVWIVSENNAADYKKMTDTVLADKVHQYHPEPFSVKTLMILCASTKYLSHINVLDCIFRHDHQISALTQCCKLYYVFISIFCFLLNLHQCTAWISQDQLRLLRVNKTTTAEARWIIDCKFDCSIVSY